MSLQAAGMHPLPDTGFLECLTTLPFGKMYLDLADGPIAFFSNLAVNPDQGLSLALKALGWTCEERRGQTADEALASLRAAVSEAPALIGPVDLGYLSYNPFARDLAGGDHFVLALAIEDETILLHDPWKFPCASLPISEFMQAWRAERIDYAEQPYTFRAHFSQLEQVSLEETIARTLSTIADNLKVEQNGPVAYTNVHALHMLAASLRSNHVPSSISESLTTFVLPLGARRGLDAAAFLREAKQSRAAHCMEQQAMLCGQAQYLAAHNRFSEVADLITRLSEVEQELIERLLATAV
jgi:hypothetical protein